MSSVVLEILKTFFIFNHPVYAILIIVTKIKVKRFLVTKSVFYNN